MQLSFHQPYKSISSLSQIELNDFSVITGFNGAGKSHLLQAVQKGSVKVDGIVPNEQTHPIRLFDWTTLFPSDTGAFAPSQTTQEREQLWQQLSQFINQQTIYFRTEVSNLNIPNSGRMGNRNLLELTPETLISDDVDSAVATAIVDAIRMMSKNHNNQIANQFFQHMVNSYGMLRDNPEKQEYVRQIINLTQTNAKLPLIAFTSDEFYDHFPITWQATDLFQQAFSRLFADYQRVWKNNRLLKALNEDGEKVSFLSNEDFIVKYGEPPWEVVNAVLEAASLDFRINHPYRYEDRPYEPILTDQIRGSQVKFNDLSSGERILMSFALCLYYAGDNRQIVDYPKVLLFDEIDAPLHPSMTQSLLRTIEEVLVKQRGIKVIMTTHSPSTVALCPEGSLYVMHKEESKRVQTTTKDKALSILTTGVPTLSIDHQNRRQVFVESRYDEKFYEQIYEKLKEHLVPEISINFIASGVKGVGSSSQVKDVVSQLSGKGNRTVYGIIDWDLNNISNERVKVLGQNKRYSIENYILDPVLVAILLLRDKKIERSVVGLNDNEVFTDCGKMSSVRLQSIANYIVSKVEANVQPTSNHDTLQCYYVGGKAVELPKWFIQMQGHRLEETLKDVFHPLNKFQKEELKSEILVKVIDDAPSLIPQDFVDLFREIQNVSV